MYQESAVCMSGFCSGKYDLLTFYGRHAMERTMQREPVTHGSHVIGSVRGTSSHQYNPMMILADENTTDQYGNCYAMSFVYSGNFKGETLKDQFGQTRALMYCRMRCSRIRWQKEKHSIHRRYFLLFPEVE